MKSDMKKQSVEKPDSQNLELKLLIEAIWQKYGYDFRMYAMASFKRRILRVLVKYGFSSISDLLHKTLTEPDFFALLLNELTVTVTEMFRDPHVYKSLREQVFPYLKTYPEIKIWSAGCAGGEEVYSLAILLKEEGLYDRAIIYGTDINPSALRRAKQGILDADSVKGATKRYFDAGGKVSLHEYYTAKYGAVLLNSNLRERVIFSDHNLVSDAVFGEMQLVVCRNALIYFNRELHERAIGLFKDSLCPGGFLCLGTKERLNLSQHEPAFETFSKSESLYRKRKET